MLTNTEAQVKSSFCLKIIFPLCESGNYASLSVLKRKTSITIDEKLLGALKREAKRQDRSVSYILEKFIEAKLASIAEESPDYGSKRRNHSRAQ